MTRKAGILNKLTVAGLVMVAIGFVGSFAVIVALAIHDKDYGEASGRVEAPDDNSIELVMPWEDDDYSSLANDDPAADDGELHDARAVVDNYEFEEAFWAVDETQHIDAYDADAACLFSVSYPKLKGDSEQLENANKLLRSAAMQTVRTYYEDPDADTVERVRRTMESGSEYTPDGADMVLKSVVDYAVTYNNEHFISVVFSDQYQIGNSLLSFIEMRTVNINLDTGEVYELPDVLKVRKSMAKLFTDNLVQTSGEDSDNDGVITDEECLTIVIAGRETFEAALRGKGELANRVSTCFFVDGNGRVNLGANYLVSSSEGAVSGWWDVTLTDEQIESGKVASTFWDLISS